MKFRIKSINYNEKVGSQNLRGLKIEDFFDTYKTGIGAK